MQSTEGVFGHDDPRLRSFGCHCVVRLDDRTLVGEGDALLSRDWTDDESSDLGFVNEPWWGSVELVEEPNEALVDRLNRERQVRLGEWTRGGEPANGFPELRLAIVITGRNYRHLLISETGPWIEQPGGWPGA